MLLQTTLEAVCAQAELFEQASQFDGRPRERILALAEAEDVYFQLHPYHYRALQTVRIASQMSRAAYRRDDTLRRCESRTISILMKVIKDATEAGDLHVGSPRRTEELAFVIWSLAFGTRALMDTTVAVQQLGVTNGSQVAREFTQALLDGLGWQPLSSEWDYAHTCRRIREELFAEQWRQINAAKNADSPGETPSDPSGTT